MTDPLIFTVHGTPQPKARPRFVGGRAVSTTKPMEKLWLRCIEHAIKLAIHNRQDATPLFTGPVRVRMVFTFVPPASKMVRLGQPHTQKPDTDNLYKGIADQMERWGLFKNDSQVADAPVEKWWGNRAGVTVTVEPIAEQRAPTVAASVPPAWMVDAIAKAGCRGGPAGAPPPR